MNDKTLFASSYSRGLILSSRWKKCIYFFFIENQKTKNQLNRSNKDDQKTQSRHHWPVKWVFFSGFKCIDSKLSLNNRSQCHIMKCKYLFFLDGKRHNNGKKLQKYLWEVLREENTIISFSNEKMNQWLYIAYQSSQPTQPSRSIETLNGRLMEFYGFIIWCVTVDRLNTTIENIKSSKWNGFGCSTLYANNSNVRRLM